MRYLKTVEIIKKEFEDYNTKTDFIHSLDDFKTYVEMGILDNYENMITLKKEKQANKRLKIIDKIRNFITFNFYDETAFYDEDNEILDCCLTLIEKQNDYFLTILEIANDNNFKELLKLMDFSVEYYNKHLDYFEMRRDRLEYAYRGITYSNSSYSDNRETFSNFFSQVINSLKQEKSMAKTVKI